MSTETKKNTYKKKVTLKNKKKLKPYEGGGEGEEASIIKVLCWNIYWMAMEGYDRNELTPAEILQGVKQPGRLDERKFGRYCADGKKISNTELNICATRVKELIEVVNYDFVALQEASNWDIIHNKLKKTITMGYVHYKLNSNNLVTFYDKTKYTLIAFNTGILSVKEDVDDRHNIRPYHILLLHDLSKNYYIFINLHAPHNITKDAIERQLSNAMEDFYAISDETEKASISEEFNNIKSTAANIQNINTRFKAGRNTYNTIKPTTTQYEMKWDAQNYNIIVAGDFNDTGGKFWNGLQPFKYSSITILETLEVKLDKKPPPTCCSTNLENLEYNNIGDYILVNKTLKVLDIYTPHLTVPVSDHLPIIIYIRPTSINSEHKEHVASLEKKGPSNNQLHEVASPALIEETEETEEQKLEGCIPSVIYKLYVPGDGACLFSSLLYGLIRLKEQNVLSMDLSGAYKEGVDIPHYVASNVLTFRNIIVDSLDTFLNANIYELSEGQLIEMGRFLYHDKDTIEVNKKSVREAIVKSYINTMRLHDTWGDQIIITEFRLWTNINVVIFTYNKKTKSSNISGNWCNDGIWLYYDGGSHYEVIFPIDVINEFKDVYKEKTRTLDYEFFKDKIFHIPEYNTIIAITTVEAQAPVPAIATPQANAPTTAPVPAKAPATALIPALTPAPKKLKKLTKKPPAPTAQAQAKTPPKKPPAPTAQAQTQAQTQTQAPETGSETGAPTIAPTGALTPTPTPTPEPGSETGAALAATLAATTLTPTPTPTPTGLAGRSRTRRTEQIHGEEQNSETQHLIEPISGNTQYDESYSNNMFFIPLIGAVLALSLTFIITK